jgi:hypothetical protein
MDNTPTAIDSYLYPESILPEQFFPRLVPRVTTPAAKLMNAVLVQAVLDLRYQHARHSWMRKLYREAHEWVKSDDRSYPFTFLNLCETLGYSPSAVRQSLLRVRAPAPREQAA